MDNPKPADRLKRFFWHYIFSDEIPLDARMINMFFLVGMSAALLSIPTRALMSAGGTLLTILAAIAILLIVSMWLCNRFRIHKLFTVLTVFVLCYILIPLAFFFLGGIEGSMASYFVLCLVIIFLLLRGKLCALFAVAHVAVVVALYCFNALHPDLIKALSGSEMYLLHWRPWDRIQTYLIVGFCIAAIIKFQSKIMGLETAKAKTAAEALEVARRSATAMFDGNPHVNILFDDRFNVIDCNPAALVYMEFESKDALLSGFIQKLISGIPPTQPDGRVSIPLSERLRAVVANGSVKFETVLLLRGEPRVMDVEFRRIPYGESYAIVGYLVDLTDVRATEANLLRRGELLDAVNGVATILSAPSEDFTATINEALARIARCANLNRAYIWKRFEQGGGVRYAPVHEWLDDTGCARGPILVNQADGYIESVPAWEARFEKRECIIGRVSDLSQAERDVLERHGVCSVLLAPIYLQEKLWGFSSFDDCCVSRLFTDEEASILQSGSQLVANAVLRAEMAHHVRQSASRLKTVIGNYSGIIWSVNADGIITTFDGRYLDVIGVTPEFLEGKPLALAKKKNRHLDIIENVDKALRGESLDWTADIDGRMFHSLVTPLTDATGAIIGVMGCTDDVTEAIRLQKELTAAMTEAQNANRAKSDFLSNMSHEIRTPMNAIIGMTTIGKSSGDIDRKNYAFEKIENASAHLLGIINDILDMSKIEAGKFELSAVEFQFERMLRKVADVINFRVDEKRQKFIVHIDKRIPSYIIADDQRLAQVITNLLGNAVKFTPEEGIIRLEAELVKDEGSAVTLRVKVSDSGIGISAEQQTRLFKSFQQADSGTTRKFGGTGLGLAISKNIVEMMGGEIRVESEPGEGATFIFEILAERGAPDCINEYPGVDGSVSENDEQTEITVFEGCRILLAEDVEINREIVLTLLEPTRLSIDCAADGAEAVRLFAEAPDAYDLIFMDVQMPEMDGYEATRRIRAMDDPRAAVIPIVAMTANVFREDVERCLESGMTDHVGKPIDFDEVIEKLRTYLSPRKA